MTPAMSMRRILAGVLGDVADYRRLRDLLEAQFAAALRHRAQDISDIVNRILELTAVLEARRRERVALAGVLLTGNASGARVTLQAVAERLPVPVRAQFDDCCVTLEALVKECRRLNRRNCNLLTAQHDIMQRLLKTERYIYEPA
jgi:flagellar biosynthesis protein FlgN